MAIPVLAAPALAAGVGAVGGAVLSGAVGSALAPLNSATGYEANYVAPVLFPGADLLISAAFRGAIDTADAVNTLRVHGINAAGFTGHFGVGNRWGKALAGERPHPGVPFFLSEMRRVGGTVENNWRAFQQLTGWSEEHCRRFLSLGETAPLRWAVNRYHRLDGAEREARRVLTHHGYTDEWAQNALLNPNEPLGLLDVFAARNRGWVDDDFMMRNIRALGWADGVDADLLAKMRFQLPGVSDMIRFSQREVWKQPIVDKYRYDEELPPGYRFWCEKQGLDYVPSAIYNGVPQGGDVPWTVAYWRAHWEMPSPTQIYQALHRIRPDNVGQWKGQFPNIKAVTQDTVNEILAIHDYAPGVRDWLTAISYHPLTRTDVRRMARLGVLTREQVVSAFRDIGYDAANAENLTKFTYEDIRSTRLRQTRSRVQRSLDAALEIGTISEADYLQQSYQLLDIPQAERDDVASMPPAAQVEYARTQTDAGTRLAAALAARSVATARETLRGVKRAFLSGQLDEPAALHMLGAIGVEPGAISRHLSSWRLLLDTKYRQLSTAQVIRLHEGGQLPLSEARVRLNRLGWAAEDAGYLLALASERQAVAEARAERATARTADELRRAREKEIRANEAQQRKVRAELARSGTAPQLARWVKKGVIDRPLAEQRLRLLGWPEDDLKRLLDEAEQDSKRRAENGEAQAVP